MNARLRRLAHWLVVATGAALRAVMVRHSMRVGAIAVRSGDRCEALHGHARALAGTVRVLFLPGYDMGLAALLVAGVGVWLNTPLPPLEASGTSGMKAALNGVPSLSVLDGWWVEGCIEGVTGWSVGSGAAEAAGGDAESLYAKLEQAVLPLYYTDRTGWIRVMKGAIAKNGALFTSHRMMRRYAADAYLR